MKIYVAGSSAELDRIVRVRDRLISNGHTITEDWPSKVLAHIATGRAVNDLTPEDRRAAADADYAGVASADRVVLLVPRRPIATAGAWWEGGVADALNVPVIASGLPQDRASMIFLSRVHEVDTDEEAIDLCQDDLLRRYVEQKQELERLRAHVGRIEGGIADLAHRLRLEPPPLRAQESSELYKSIMKEVLAHQWEPAGDGASEFCSVCGWLCGGLGDTPPPCPGRLTWGSRGGRMVKI